MRDIDEPANADELILSQLTENETNSSNNLTTFDSAESSATTEEKFHEFKLINANARSLNNKIGSLIDVFDEHNVSIAILSETWFRSGGALEEEMRELEDGENIAVIARNRGSRWRSSCCLQH